MSFHLAKLQPTNIPDSWKMKQPRKALAHYVPASIMIECSICGDKTCFCSSCTASSDTIPVHTGETKDEEEKFFAALHESMEQDNLAAVILYDSETRSHTFLCSKGCLGIFSNTGRISF